MYKYEVHLHSKLCSACAVSTAEEMVDAAKACGYAGMVFTNHFYHGNSSVDRHMAWKDFVGTYRDDYLRAKEYAKSFGIDVLFGLEEVYEPGKEALIYGIEPETIISEPHFLHMSITEMSDFIHKNGGFIVCAHPFRNRSYIPEPDKEPDMKLFDALEVYNYFNTPESNEKAEIFAKIGGFQVISGGDVHNCVDFGKCGLAFSERISDNASLSSALKAGDYHLLIDGSIKDNLTGNFFK